MADTPAQAPPGNTRDTDERESYYLASQWQLMWRNFKRHRLALVSAAVLAIAYLVGFVAPFVAPYTLEQRHVAYIFVPPQRIRLFADGRLSAPYVVGLQKNVNQETLRRVYTPTAERYPIRLLGRGPEYRLWGLFPPTATCSRLRKGVWCSCSAPTVWAATCSRASCTARASRSPSACAGCASRC